MSSVEACRESLLAFINRSTSPFHVVSKCEALLKDSGFTSLELGEKWFLREGEAYMVNAFGSSLFAFKIGKDMRKNMRIASAHTDFPNIRIKPNPDMKREGYHSLNVEIYGGLILYSWLDRPLSISGRVTLASEDPFAPKSVLVDFKDPLLTIPSLAIHMNRTVNEGLTLNKQTDILPIGGGNHTYNRFEGDEASEEARALAIIEEGLGQIDFYDILAEELHCEATDILFFELGLYPTEQGCSLGFHEEFISSPRIDNLTSVKACLEGLTEDTSGTGLHMIALFDNEEVGSRTKQGAASVLLQQIIERIYLTMGFTLEELFQDMAKGFMISADVAHGYHPNYGHKNDLTNKPLLNGGLVIKFASSQSYAGDGEAVATVKSLCREEDIPYQIYVNRSDIVGGSTLGSIASATLPMRTMDVGVPVLAMHSLRELMGEADQHALESLMKAFFSRS